MPWGPGCACTGRMMRTRVSGSLAAPTEGRCSASDWMCRKPWLDSLALTFTPPPGRPPGGLATGDGLGYGYQWWMGTVAWQRRALKWSAGFGNGGQRLFVVPALDLAVVITTGACNDPQIGRTVRDIREAEVAPGRDGHDAC